MRTVLWICVLFIIVLATVSGDTECVSCRKSLVKRACLVLDRTTCCGDGTVEDGEECDDLNFLPGDGCHDCIIEAGCTCSGSPSVCNCGEDDGGDQLPAENDGLLLPDAAGCSTGLSSISTRIAYNGIDTIYIGLNCPSPAPWSVALSISRDNGATWSSPLSAPFTGFGSQIENNVFQSSLSIAASGDHVIVVGHRPMQSLRFTRSTDRGLTWTPVTNVDSGFMISRAWGLNINYLGTDVYIGTSDGNGVLLLYRGAEFGASFVAVNTPVGLSTNFKDFAIADDGDLWWFAEPAQFSSSTDNGTTWSPAQSAPIMGTVFPDATFSNDHLFVVSMSGVIYRIPHSNPTTAESSSIGASSSMHYQLDTDSQGNLYAFSSSGGVLYLRYWAADEPAPSLLDPPPGIASAIQDNGAYFPQMFVFENNNGKGAVLAWTRTSSPTASSQYEAYAKIVRFD